MPSHLINKAAIRNLILEEYRIDRKVADDDKLLLARVWQRCGWDNSNTLEENLRLVPNPETIRRTRQKLVEEGLMQPSKEATEKRYKQFVETREDLGYAFVPW